MSDKPSFFAELKRRNVHKVAVAYAVVAWLPIQSASILFPTFEALTSAKIRSVGPISQTARTF